MTVRYHLTSPLCPSPFAIDIGREVRRRVEALPGVTRCRVDIRDRSGGIDLRSRRVDHVHEDGAAEVNPSRAPAPAAAG